MRGGVTAFCKSPCAKQKVAKKRWARKGRTPMKRTPKNERAGVAHVPNGLLHRFDGRAIIGGVVGRHDSKLQTKSGIRRPIPNFGRRIRQFAELMSEFVYLNPTFMYGAVEIQLRSRRRRYFEALLPTHPQTWRIFYRGENLRQKPIFDGF